jgi:hypothetical protein
MAKASIHIEPIKSSSETHNKRLKEFDYTRKDLSEKNEKWEERSISEVRREVEEKYLRNVGQKMQKKATPIREGVVLLKPEHTMADLFRLKEKLYQKLGIKTFQMYIHKDEGHWKGEEKLKQWVPNLHAHMIFDWTDDKGKSLKLDRKQMSLIQDIVSETLEMERGQRATVTGRKHLNPLEYKAKVMLDKIIEIEKKEKDLKKQLEDTQSEKEILKKDLQKLNEKYDEKHTEFQRFFQSDINVSLFKKSVSNGFFGGKKEVINEEEIKKLIQNFSFSTENWKNEEKLKKQYLREKWDLQEQLEATQKEKAALQQRINNPTEAYLREKLAEIEREERQKQEAKRKQEAEKKRLRDLREFVGVRAFIKNSLETALYKHDNSVKYSDIEAEFQTLLKVNKVPADFWSITEIDEAIREELSSRGITLQQEEQQQERPKFRLRR